MRKGLRFQLWFSATALLAALGCGGDGDGGADNAVPIDPVTDLKELARPFRDWPKPEFVLVLSGEQQGFLEPCGCSERRKGGLARRHGLVKDLEERQWSPIGLDLGGLGSGRMGQQARIKLNTTIDALKLFGYEAIGIGPEEVHFGAGDLYALSADEQNPTLLSANLRFFDSQGDYPHDSVVVEHGPWKVGVAAIYGESARLEASNEDIPFRQPAEVLAEVTGKLEEAHLRVLLAHASRKETEALLKAFPQFHLVLCTGGGDAPPQSPEIIDDTMLVQVGRKGMHVGVVGFFGDQDPMLRYELIELDESWPETDAMKQRLAMYQEELQDQDVIGSLFEQADAHPNQAVFVGAAQCGECHTKAYAKWKQTRHAKAFDDLVTAKHQFDPECITCHTTGWQPQQVVPYEGGFRSLAETPHLVGNGCENCHGAGSLHVEAERGSDEALRNEWRKRMQLTEAWAQENLCAAKCHDEDNSPDFTFFKYWKEVLHPGKD